MANHINVIDSSLIADTVMDYDNRFLNTNNCSSDVVLDHSTNNELLDPVTFSDNNSFVDGIYIFNSFPGTYKPSII